MIHNNIKASIISERPKGVNFLSSCKNIKTYKININNPATSSINSKLNTESSSFFGSNRPRSSSGGRIFENPRKSYVDDRPSPESPKNYYDERKKIIFRKINIKDNEKEILKLIFDSQKNINELMKGKFKFFCTLKIIHSLVESLKENIANYCLVFRLYINEKLEQKANELFLLMEQQNKKLLYNIFEEIKQYFKNLTPSNKIAEFFPSIIKMFFQILSAIIKLSAKFNKNLLENYYLKMYFQTIHKVKNTILTKFTSPNNDLESDFKLMGRFFYNDCIYKMGIYFLYRYQSLNIIISLFQFIFEQYQEKDIVYLINSEQILLLKINYNLAVLYFADGNNFEAIVNLGQAKERLSQKIAYPYITLKEIQLINNPLPVPTNKINSNESNNNYQERTSISSFNIDENVEKVIMGTGIRKRSISSNFSHDFKINEKNNEPIKEFCSNITFGKEKFIFQEQSKFVNNSLSQKIEIEIELFLAEIELDQKNFNEAFIHVNKILDIIKYPSKKFLKEKTMDSKKILNIESSSTNSNFSHYLRLADYNKNNYSNKKYNNLNISKIKKYQTLSESNRRHISYILDEIEQEFKKRNEYLNSNNEIQNFDDEYNNSKKNQLDLEKRLNQNINRERKICKETEKFFIFICGLSIYQLKILNEFQPDPSQKRDDLPILFPNQFIDCLTFSQRIELNNLDTMSLSRYIILKDSNKDISPENLDYVFLTRKIKSSHKDNLVAHEHLNNFLMRISKKNAFRNMNSIDSIGESKYGSIKKNLFDKETFQKFVEEDKIFNEKISEIIKKDNQKFVEINKYKILKIIHGLNQKEKELLMKSPNCFNKFLKKIEKKICKK